MKLGLVLSGGGIRGAAHLGAIKALEEHGISPNYIAGTSAGAIVGALYAYGYKWDDILTFFSKTQIIDLKKFAINKPGFIDAEKFYSSFKTYLKHDDFGSLKKHLKVTAANILNGNLEVFEAGELIKPVIASSAIPGLFSPVKINDNYYVDGGALNNFPVELLKDTCDVIIGVYVNGFVPITINELKYSHNVVERAFKLKQVKEDQLKFNDCDLVIYPKELSKYGTFDKKHLHEIFAIGYEAAMKVLTNNTDFKNTIFKK
ncbi:patatin-like phospholipase family protein [Algibacter luteus]|uniref:NTE family protein n=1 Tax=Algibacter luteus TaxID=1178825 RepID=A0A1M6BZU5_9FLAO|nr:patatin-like phospholipase family protein [Algibacter luteus]SHI54305.1 NTE family protein [Algibacter luteus]